MLLVAPISVKILILFYLAWIFLVSRQVGQPEVIRALGSMSTWAHLVLSGLILTLIFLRQRWTWIVGVVESLWHIILAAYILTQSGDVMAKAAETVGNDPQFIGRITPEQAAAAVKAGLMVALVILVFFSLIKIVLWFKSRSYFQKFQIPQA